MHGVPRSRTIIHRALDAGTNFVDTADIYSQGESEAAPIVGPRTMEQLESQLGAADVTLSADILDAIDEIVPPGVTLSAADAGYVAPALSDPLLRRRRTA